MITRVIGLSPESPHGVNPAGFFVPEFFETIPFNQDKMDKHLVNH